LLGGVERGNHLAPPGFWSRVGHQCDACVRVARPAAADHVAGPPMTRRDDACGQGEGNDTPPARGAPGVVEHRRPFSVGLQITSPRLRTGRRSDLRRIYELRHQTGTGVGSATTVHIGHSAIPHGNERQDVALLVAGRCAHGAKPNRIRSTAACAPCALARQQPRDDHQHHQNDQHQRHPRARHPGHRGASSVWRARRISRMPLPSRPSSTTATR